MRIRENLTLIILTMGRMLIWLFRKFDLWDVMYFGGAWILFRGLRGMYGLDMALAIVGTLLAVTAIIGAGLLRWRVSK